MTRCEQAITELLDPERHSHRAVSALAAALRTGRGRRRRLLHEST